MMLRDVQKRSQPGEVTERREDVGHESLRPRKPHRALRILPISVLGAVIVAAASLGVQARFFPPQFEGNALLRVGSEALPADPGGSVREPSPQAVQATAQSLHREEVAREAALRTPTTYSAEQLFQRCKTAQNQDTAIISVTCQAPDAKEAANVANAFAAAAVTVNDRRLEREQSQLVAVYDAQRNRYEAELKVENDRIASLRGNSANAPELSAALTRQSEIERELDQLFTAQQQLALRRTANLLLVSSATVPTNRMPPTPAQIGLAGVIVGLALGFELGLLLTRPRWTHESLDWPRRDSSQ
jgi:uncharacterized protein involved in exopolysaccharide biosynthesis